MIATYPNEAIKKGLICDVCPEKMPFCKCSCKADQIKYYLCRPDDTCNFHACIRGRCRCGGWWDFPEELELLVKRKAEVLIEKVADFMHDQWSRWMKYQQSKEYHGMFAPDVDGVAVHYSGFKDEDKKRWHRQMETPYDELSEKEKDSDREWARKLIKLLEENE